MNETADVMPFQEYGGGIVGRYQVIICVAIVMHMIWAFGLAIDQEAINATGLHTLLVVAHLPSVAAVIYCGVATLATVGLSLRQTPFTVFLILPQQVVLWFSIVGALHAMYLGQFADGVQRDNWFLIVDQIPVVLIGFGHTVALLFLAGRIRHAET